MGFDSSGSGLPNIFPKLSTAMRCILLADFEEPQAEIAAGEWLADYETVIRHGLAGVAVRVIRENSFVVPPSVVDKLEKSQFEDMVHTSAIVLRSQTGIDALRSVDIPFVVTKGPGIARQGTALADRPYIDLDVVVDPKRFTEARRVLSSVGYSVESRSIQPWTAFDRYCQEATNLRTPEGGSIDLHHRVAPWYWSGGLTLDYLASAAETAKVFGVQLPLASPEHNLLVAALHVVSDKARPGQTLRAWRDLLVLARRCSTDSVVEAAEATELGAWILWILQCLPVEVQPIELVDGLQQKRHQIAGQWRLRMLLPPRLGSRHVLGLALRLPLKHAAIYGVGVMLPSPTFLRYRYPDESHRYLTWWRSALGNLISKIRRQAP
jgi:hypothetical protein